MELNDQDIKENRKNNPPKPGQLVPYHLDGKNQPMLYNSVQVVSDGTKAPTAEDFQITGLPIELVPGVNSRLIAYPKLSSYSYRIMKSSPGKLFGSQIDYYTYLYKTAGPTIFWNSLMKTADHYSVRQYLTQM